MEYPQIRISKEQWMNVFEKVASGAYPPSQRYIQVTEQLKESDKSAKVAKKKSSRSKPESQKSNIRKRV